MNETDGLTASAFRVLRWFASKTKAVSVSGFQNGFGMYLLFAVLIGSPLLLGFVVFYSCFVAAARADLRLNQFRPEEDSQMTAMSTAFEKSSGNLPALNVLEIPVNFTTPGEIFQAHVEIRPHAPRKTFCSNRLKHRLPV